MSCPYYEFKSGFFIGGDYYCNIKNSDVNSDIYSRYCSGYSYAECSYYQSKHSSSGACFITTMACQVLGLDDHDPIMDNLRQFRKDILRENKKYYNVLKEYDVIGPKIVDCVMNENENDRNQMAFYFYQSTVLPVNELIKKKEYDAAVILYTLTTRALIDYYGLTKEYYDLKARDYDYEGFDPKLAGCGKKKTRELKNNI